MIARGAIVVPAEGLDGASDLVRGRHFGDVDADGLVLDLVDLVGLDDDAARVRGEEQDVVIALLAEVERLRSAGIRVKGDSCGRRRISW